MTTQESVSYETGCLCNFCHTGLSTLSEYVPIVYEQSKNRTEGLRCPVKPAIGSMFFMLRALQSGFTGASHQFQPELDRSIAKIRLSLPSA